MSGVFGAKSPPTHRFGGWRKTKHRTHLEGGSKEVAEGRCRLQKKKLSPENLYIWAMTGGHGLMLSDLLFSE